MIGATCTSGAGPNRSTVRSKKLLVALEQRFLKGTDGRMRSHRVIKIGIETVEIGPVEFEASVRLKVGS